MEELSAEMRKITGLPMLYNAATGPERWQKVLADVKADLLEYGIEHDPVNLPEIMAKVLTGTTAGNKGICFLGGVGSGKTKRVRFLASVGRNIHFCDAAALCNEWLASDGDDNDLREYIGVTGYKHELVIDDLGTESEKYVCYGNSVDVMTEKVIPWRYNVFPQYRTFFTTNLTKQQLRDRYGERCWSRLNEMCAFVPLTHADRRLER